MSNLNYGVVIQARTSSTRLPGKVLMDIHGKPMLLRQVERLQHKIKSIPIVVATSTDKTDDAIVDLCKSINLPYFRGGLNDVMGRFIQCAQTYDLTHIVRVGGDDPLIDPDCCTTLIKLHQKGNHDLLYASNRDGWPYGCAAELFSVESLRAIHDEEISDFYKEHTIPFYFDHEEKFDILRVHAPEYLRRSDLYFTVDYIEDFNLICAVFDELKQNGEYFTLSQLIELMNQRPELRNMNAHLHKGFER